MAYYFTEPSHTFSEYLLVPGYSSKECIPANVSLKTPVVKFKKGEKSNPSSLFTLLGDEEDALSLADYGFVEGDGASKYAACVGALQAEYLTAEKNRLAHEYEKDKNVDCLKQIMQIDRRLQRIRNKGGNA